MRIKIHAKGHGEECAKVLEDLAQAGEVFWYASRAVSGDLKHGWQNLLVECEWLARTELEEAGCDNFSWVVIENGEPRKDATKACLEMAKLPGGMAELMRDGVEVFANLESNDCCIHIR